MRLETGLSPLLYGTSRSSEANAVLLTLHSFSAAKHRAGWGSVRGSPVLSSHFSFRLAPQVGQRTPKACSFSAFMNYMMPESGNTRWSIVTTATNQGMGDSMSTFDERYRVVAIEGDHLVIRGNARRPSADNRQP
jgi:hypothetical protein